MNAFLLSGLVALRRLRPTRKAATYLLYLLAPYTYEHTSRSRGTMQAPLENPLGYLFQHFSTPCHSVWGRVVPDIPDFCRELIAALAEE